MPQAQVKSLEKPDQTIPMEHGKIEVVSMGGGGVGRVTLERGWKWSEHEKPVVGGGEYCEVAHFGYQVSGRLHIVMSDGQELETQAGDVVVLPAGHDGWVIGDEPVVLVDFGGVVAQA